jgi:large conductance mechanosensitive channel
MDRILESTELIFIGPAHKLPDRSQSSIPSGESLRRIAALPLLLSRTLFEVPTMLNDFKAFLQRGNVVELAVAVVMGGAFGKIVASLVDDLVMPIVGAVLGGVSFKDLAIKAGESTIKYGNFIQTAFDFAVVGFVVFMLVRAYERLKGEKVKTSA